MKNKGMKRNYSNWRIAFIMAVLCLWGGVQGWAQTPDSTDNSNIQHMGNFTPSNIVETVTYNPATNQYTIVKSIGTVTISTETISADEYQRRKMNQATADYWRKKENAQSQGTETNSLIPKININNEIFKNIFGSSKI